MLVWIPTLIARREDGAALLPCAAVKDLAGAIAAVLRLELGA